MNISQITNLFLPQMDGVKNLILSEAAIRRCSTKQKFPSPKSCKVAGFQPLVTAAMWAILDAAEFLDPLPAFTYRRKDGYFSFDAISVYKVYYIDF